MKSIKVLFIIMLICFSQTGFSAKPIRVEPMFWWVGMKNPNLQLLVYAKDISRTNVMINYDGIEIKSVQRIENQNYLFIDITITEKAKPGKFLIVFNNEKETVYAYEYELKERKAGSAQRKSITNADNVYLLMPDRFANGNPANDNIDGMLEKANRNLSGGRHGGDIKGIVEHLDYIIDLGFTALWMTPLLENNQAEYSYHGYGATDFYKIDSRFGSNDDYVNLVNIAHQKGLKIIQDMIFNHTGIGHWWMKDFPSNDWMNNEKKFGQTNFRGHTVVDKNVSSYDYNKMTNGWFVSTMPDMNQHNPFLAKYLIQNSIWWIEYANIDGIRMDTYPYPFKDFMAEWAKQILTEYPNFNIVGEYWINKPSMVSYFQKDAKTYDGYNGYLPSLFDFPLQWTMESAFNNSRGGMSSIYETLAEDFLYPNPEKLYVFFDNHDLTRFYSRVNQNLNSLKMAIALILTVRGIPEMYYGTEILMTSVDSNGDGDRRKDFPGGWIDDKINAFTSNGRTKEQNEIFNYIRTINHFRKNSTVLHYGKFMHFIPDGELYVYFRYDEKNAVMVVLNNDDKNEREFSTERFNEILGKYKSAKNIITGEILNNISKIKISTKSALIFELIP